MNSSNCSDDNYEWYTLATDCIAFWAEYKQAAYVSAWNFIDILHEAVLESKPIKCAQRQVAVLSLIPTFLYRAKCKVFID